VIFTGPSLANGDVGMLASRETSRDSYGDCRAVERVTTFVYRDGGIIGIYDNYNPTKLAGLTT
jgi:hypothetical protein